MGDSILSQAEIDALLNGDSETKDEPISGIAKESDIRPYDPNTQRRVVRERLQALEIINERFARQFRMGLFNLLRRSPDITVGAIRIQPYHEFARNLPVPTNLNLIHLKPLRGTGLVVFSPSLVFIAVDNLFGGDGRFPTKVEGREFTHTEQRVINRMLKLALESYSDAWKAINPLEVEYARKHSTANPRCGTRFLFAVLIFAILVFSLVAGQHSEAHLWCCPKPLSLGLHGLEVAMHPRFQAERIKM